MTEQTSLLVIESWLEMPSLPYTKLSNINPVETGPPIRRRENFEKCSLRVTDSNARDKIYPISPEVVNPFWVFFVQNSKTPARRFISPLISGFLPPPAWLANTLINHGVPATPSQMRPSIQRLDHPRVRLAVSRKSPPEVHAYYRPAER